MRTTAFILAAALLLATGSAWADCSMHTASKDQSAASGKQAPSTPIPPKANQG